MTTSLHNKEKSKTGKLILEESSGLLRNQFRRSVILFVWIGLILFLYRIFPAALCVLFLLNLVVSFYTYLSLQGHERKKKTPDRAFSIMYAMVFILGISLFSYRYFSAALCVLFLMNLTAVWHTAILTVLDNEKIGDILKKSNEEVNL